MTTDELRRLADLAESDSELMTALRNADTREEVVLIAQQHGVRIEESDLIASAEPLDTELSDADLATAAGGGHHPKYSTFDYACPLGDP